ncbi:MAG: hypothetical protein AMXMBFR84_41830 [Candidatus Hydrogenedentota bacterium]
MVNHKVAPTPKGLMLLMALGPGLIWCGEYIGSGEVILSTRTGAIYGVALLWVPTMAIFAKFWIGLAGAHYTVTTGEGMIDMMSRMPGPRNWAVWPVFVGQICSGSVSTAALASAAASFAGYFMPGIPSVALAWVAVLLVITLVWTGLYDVLKQAMSLCVLLIVIGTMAVALYTWPGIAAVLKGMFGFQLPSPPSWLGPNSSSLSPWHEILPLLGWAAGGFASQVWYTYWVMGAGYGMAKDRGYGQPLDEKRLMSLSAEDAQRIRGWRRVVTLDASMAVVIGIVVTVGFMMAGAGVLGPKQVAPEGANVAMQLSAIFGNQWGRLGAHLFVLAGLAAMISTMIGQFAGWPRLIADCARILIPGVKRYPWKVQFRVILLLIAASNMLIVYTFDFQPVFMVKLGAILDGLLLTPLQALVVGWVLYRVMPRFFPPELRLVLKPSPILAAGLSLAFVIFSFVCVFRLGEIMGS